MPSGTIVDVPGKAIENSRAFVRIMTPATSFLEKISYRLRGCQILHELSDATALRCPANVQIEGAFEDRVYHIMDMDANLQINADDVWALGYTGSGITVAVLDTGIDTDHPELISSIAGGKGFGYDTFEDDHDHGTHVSGIITADGVGGTPLGFAKGVAPDAGIWMAKVCNASGSCYSSDIAAAIEYVVNNNIAKIMSISLGGGGTSRANCDSDYLATKVNWAVDNGVTVVAAAGNTAGVVSSPGCASKVIAVGAVNKSDVRASWSGTGLALDIMAPGVSIYSSVIGGYASWSGTSMATPHISATTALLRQVNSALTDAEIKDALYKTAKDLGTTGWDKYYGWGRVDALAAVNYVKPLEPECVAGETRICGETDVGVCEYGIQTCTEQGTWGECVGAIYPSKEVCDGLDNDCDGLTDEDGVCEAVKCWSADYGYLYRNNGQAKKFCKCASGIYGYSSYNYTWSRKTVYYYLDSGNNTNWEVSSRSSYLPIYQVICTDGQVYPTNWDYYYGQ